MTGAHVIEELRFDIDFGSEDEAFELQERLRQFAQGRAQQVIAEVFDQAIESDAILRLEKLEVDIGTVAPADFEDRFAERLRDELQRLLRDRRAPALHSRPPEPGKSESPSGDHLTTGARAELEWLLHFIERGCLPWHAPVHIGRDLHGLAARVLEANGVPLARALRAAPASRWRTIFRRLVAQFPAEWLAQLGRQIGLARHPSGVPAHSEVLSEVDAVAKAAPGDDPTSRGAGSHRIYIANAGAVILGAHLPRLFSMLGLTNKESFATPSCAQRAVHLIQYIVTRSTVTPEPLLVLNKILCGLPVSAPIPLEIDLRAQEQAAIEDMLTAIIAHWKAIGHTSIAGLRESFLQREGRLVFSDDAWRLRVESKCFDMLLDRLPWGYATVKYPWMKRVLHVDWR